MHNTYALGAGDLARNKKDQALLLKKKKIISLCWVLIVACGI